MVDTFFSPIVVSKKQRLLDPIDQYMQENAFPETQIEVIDLTADTPTPSETKTPDNTQDVDPAKDDDDEETITLLEEERSEDTPEVELPTDTDDDEMLEAQLETTSYPSFLERDYAPMKPRLRITLKKLDEIRKELDLYFSPQTASQATQEIFNMHMEQYDTDWLHFCECVMEDFFDDE
jgi:hypothetical protein